MTGREKEIIRHLGEDDLDRSLTETDDEKISKRLTFIKRLYKGATLEDTADDVGMSQSTRSRWARLWNEGGLGKLDDEQRERLIDLPDRLSRTEKDVEEIAASLGALDDGALEEEMQEAHEELNDSLRSRVKE